MARTICIALLCLMLTISSTSAHQRLLLQTSDPAVTVHHLSDILAGDKKGSAAASASSSAVTDDVADVSVDGPPSPDSPPSPPSPVNIGDLLKKQGVIPNGNFSLAIPGTPGRNESLTVTLPSQSFGIDANGSACVPPVPTNYMGFPGWYCSCPLIPDVGNLLAGFSYDGSFGLPGISYSNYLARRLLQDSTSSSNDTCSAAVPTLLTFEGCNCTCKVAGAASPPPAPYSPPYPPPSPASEASPPPSPAGTPPPSPYSSPNSPPYSPSNYSPPSPPSYDSWSSPSPPPPPPPPPPPSPQGKQQQQDDDPHHHDCHDAATCT